MLEKVLVTPLKLITEPPNETIMDDFMDDTTTTTLKNKFKQDKQNRIMQF